MKNHEFSINKNELISDKRELTVETVLKNKLIFFLFYLLIKNFFFFLIFFFFIFFSQIYQL